MKYIYLILFIGSIYSCSNVITYDNFEPRENASADQIEGLGYDRVLGVDVLLFEKRTDGVLHELQFYDRDGKELGAEIWTITIQEINSADDMKLALKEIGFIAMTEINLKGRTAISSLNTNAIYLCKVISSNQLRIEYHHLIDE